MKHVMAISYKPKEAAVIDGRCTQTIRIGRRVNVLDEILFHGWAMKPRRSPWSWRKRVVVMEAIPIEVSNWGMNFPKNLDDSLPYGFSWAHPHMDHIAAKDFIDPPTGTALRDALMKFHKLGEEEVPFQIIRWRPI